MHSHPGRVAKKNDDAALADDARRLYVVSDGVGSCRDASLASRIAVETSSQALLSTPSPDIRKTLAWAAREANRRIQEAGRSTNPPQVLAATLTLLLIRDEDFHVLHVGDTRAYLLREGRLLLVTRDHSVAFDQYWKGAITIDDVRSHPNQNVLTRTLGTAEYLVPDFTDGPVRDRDRFLLCSDGVTKELDQERIATILAQESSPAGACRRFIDEANAAGGRDNVTAVVADVVG